jgi:uncharacterized membrane protein
MVNTGGPAPAAAGAGPAPAAQAMPAASGMTDNVASALCYVLGFITGIIFLILAPYNQNRTVRFHAFQSIFMNVGIIAIEIALSIVMSILGRIIGVFSLLGLVIFPVIGLGCFILWLFLIISAYQGKTIVLPIVGPLAQKQA